MVMVEYCMDTRMVHKVATAADEDAGHSGTNQQQVLQPRQIGLSAPGIAPRTQIVR